MTRKKPNEQHWASTWVHSVYMVYSILDRYDSWHTYCRFWRRLTPDSVTVCYPRQRRRFLDDRSWWQRCCSLSLRLTLSLSTSLTHSLALAHVHLLFPLFRFVAVLVVSSVYFSNSSSCYCCCCYFCPLSRHRGRTHDDKRGRRRQDTRTTVIMLMMMMRHNWKIIEIKIKKRWARATLSILSSLARSSSSSSSLTLTLFLF